MADIIDIPAESIEERPLVEGKEKPSGLWARIALGAVLLLSIFMNFFQLGQNGYGNLYYAAGVRSMADSIHNFFFVSFDPGGFVTIDKPPLGFWLQTISTKIFGFSAFSIFLPQALCGVLAVLLLYALVRRHFGVVAGLVAALALAVSPISVVTNRNNTIDSTLALALLLAAWAVIHAAETGKLRWLLLSAVLVGVGFNIKMAEAYLVIPALVMTYLLCAPRKLWTRIWHLSLFVLVMLALSLSWAAVVDLTPPAQHPYVGSTQNDSELGLAFGYNGLNRLHIGGNTNGGRAGITRPSGNTGAVGNTTNRAPVQTPAVGGVIFESGAPSLFRLFSVSLGGQIAWLLPFALLAILALAWQRRWNFSRDRRQLGLVLWGFWLLTMTVFFTLDGSFHQYYMTEMAPGLSAMVGIGLVTMWQDYSSKGWRGWLLPIALVATAAAQLYMLTSYPTWSQWLSPLIGGLTALALIVLIFFRLRAQQGWKVSTLRLRTANVALGIGMFALLIAPTLWSGYSVIHNTESSAPAAGPTAQSSFNGTARGNGFGGQRANGQQSGFGGFGGGTQANSALISYLEAHQGNTRFLVAVTNASAAEPIILATNKPVMALGGFSGSDPILTASNLQILVSNGTIRYFLLSAPRTTQDVPNQLPEQSREDVPGVGGFGGFGGFGRAGQSALSSWVGGHCSVVPASAWQTSTSNGNAGLGGNQLYDCTAAHS